jgi:hypothetical protein
LDVCEGEAGLSERWEDIFERQGSGASPIDLATHEAAHAVIAVHLGLSLFWVEIDLVGGRGEMTLDTSSPWHSPTACQRLLIAQAGSAAQCKLRGTDLDWTFEGTNDRLIGDDLAEEFGLSQNDFAEIDRLLSEPGIWERITKLAEALLVTNRIEIPHLAEFLQPISAP